MEKDRLISFLQANLKIPVSADGDKLALEPKNTTPQELTRLVTKFIYKRNLNNSYYVTVDGGTVRIQSFKTVNKKPEKTKKGPVHQTAAQSWGL